MDEARCANITVHIERPTARIHRKESEDHQAVHGHIAENGRGEIVMHEQNMDMNSQRH